MDWGTLFVTQIVLVLLLRFFDGKAVQELRLLFQALAKLANHLYLVLLPLRRAAHHIFTHDKQPWPPRLTIMIEFCVPAGRDEDTHAFLNSLKKIDR
ncbi:unnamed protein product [Arctogadus glacialis]